MTDQVLQKLEEKMMALLAEFEELRKELQRIKQENITLKAEHDTYTYKLEGLVSLLDAFEITTPLAGLELAKKEELAMA